MREGITGEPTGFEGGGGNMQAQVVEGCTAVALSGNSTSPVRLINKGGGGVDTQSRVNNEGGLGS